MSEIVQKLANASQQLTSEGAPWAITEKTLNGVSYPVFSQTPDTMKALLDAGRVHGDKSFLVYENEHYSFNDFYRISDAIAHQLVERFKVKQSDRIAIAMRNYPEWMMAYCAIVSLGAIAVPLNSWGKAEDLQYGLSDSGASVVFCDQQRYEAIAGFAQETDLQCVLTRQDDSFDLSPAHLSSWQELVVAGEGQSVSWFNCDSEDPVMIMYTSGTTGNPKGALSCHRAIIQAIFCFEFQGTASAMANEATIVKMMESGFEAASLLAVPLFHVSGLHACFMLSLRGGRKIVMMYKWDPGQALSLIEEHRITIFSGAPSMVIDMLEHPDFEQRDTRSLLSIGAGGAATPERMRKQVYAKVEDAYMGAGYGLTETNAICASCTGGAYRYKPTSAGTVAPIVQVQTRDEDGKVLAQGERGELWVKSPTNVNGYWNRADATAESFVDGWFASGDIGYVDEEGFVFVVDRLKDVIIRGGENISSGEVESCILNHSAVHEVAAFGYPHDTLGEEVAVVIHPQETEQTDKEAIQSWVKQHLAGFKVPSHVFISKEPLPRNPSGKVLKQQLKATYID